MVQHRMIVVLLMLICFGSLTEVSTEVNLALNKDVSMSSVNRPGSEEWTVNGNRAQTMASGSCSSTQVEAYDVEAWWRVDLGEVYSITGVKIYYLNEDTLYRFSGFQVFITNKPGIVASTPCYKDNDGIQGEPFPASIVSLLNCTGEGRYITIYKKRESEMCTSETTNVDFCSILEICEVEIYGGNTCVNCKSNSDCDSSSGTCTGGCIAGYTGERCTEECPEGSYGDECNDKCGHCLQDTKCDHVNGTCPQGCADGWKGTLCDRECEDGKYGPGCLLTCSCSGNFLCNHVNGECSPKRCEGGNTCVNCKSNSDCDSSSGTCTGGCIVGYTGERCTEECPEGSYGDECNDKCGHCLQDTKCDHVNGTCPQGCADGWKGSLCDRECEDGKYGPGCLLTCSCGGNFLCNHVNGECSPKRCEARKSLPFAMEIYMKNHIPSAVKPGYRQSSRDDLEKCKMLCIALNFCKLIAVNHADKGSDCKIYDDASPSDSFTSSIDYDVFWKVEY